MVAAVFSGQGLGQLAAALVALTTTEAFKRSFIGVADAEQCGTDCQLAADRAWRIIVGVGAVPACLALYYRLTIPETPRYTFDVAHDIEKADADIRGYMESKSGGVVDAEKQARTKKIAGPSLSVPKASWPDIALYFGQWQNAKVLLGTTFSWFFLVLSPRLSSLHVVVQLLTLPRTLHFTAWA
jgi:MFS transporter, PHS family, inorganic phosphate transporter